MKRRDFIKSLSVLGGVALAPSMFGRLPEALASVPQRRLVNARAIALGEIGYTRPTVMPQVISIFLYGGPSELAGNLTNMDEIDAGSQNPYNGVLVPSRNGSAVTPNAFWQGAGGDRMEDMIAKGRMSIYRTVNRVKDDSKAHRPSIFSNLTGVVGEEDDRPGIATNLAAVLSANGVIEPEAPFPFVTFEGESVVFNQGGISLPLQLKPIALDRRLRNPYQRKDNEFVNQTNAQIDALANQVAQASQSRFAKVIESMQKRGEIEAFVADLQDKVANGVLPIDPDDPATQLSYPNTNFGDRLKAAVNLVINNESTLFVSLGSGGLGGWDDHDDALDKYSSRMANLMTALDVAAKHLEAAGKRNVVITVFGDFGRNVNLNNSLGWDHGNNQNLYTVSGDAIDGRQLGKIVGKTQLIGTPKVNRQFTSPTSDSYQCEPFAIASTIYKYFGIQNPEALTGEAPIDEAGTANEWVNPVA